MELAAKRFEELGNPMPPAFMVHHIRFVADPRNLMDSAGYEPVDDTGRPDPDSYCVVSEYIRGETVTH